MVFFEGVPVVLPTISGTLKVEKMDICLKLEKVDETTRPTIARGKRAKAVVFHGRKTHTAGGLTKSDMYINKRGKKKLTLLHLAAFQGNTRHIEMAKWLLANGANAGARDFEGKTALDVASERGNTEIAEVIRAGLTGGRGRPLIDGGVGVSEALDF